MSDNKKQLAHKRIDVERHVKAGIVLHEQGKFDAARNSYRTALRIDRDDPDTLHLLGVVENHLGNSKKAKIMIDKSLYIRPEFAPGFESLAKVYIAQEKYTDAIEAGQRALSLNSNLLSALMPIAEAQFALGNPKDAMETYKLRDAAKPNDPITLNNISVCLIELGYLEEACKLRYRAFELEPDNYDRAYNLAFSLNMSGKFEEALSIIELTLEKEPENVPALITSGETLQALGRIGEAIIALKKAVLLAPDHPEAHFNYGLALLTKGELARGWEEYEWRKEMCAFKNVVKPLNVPIWNGEKITGKSLLIYPEQGMGDSINFIRYATIANEWGATVFCYCRPDLSDLFQMVKGIEEVIPVGAPIPVTDYQVSIMDLPKIFTSSYDNVPLTEGYIELPASDLERSTDLQVGIVWQGNPTLKNDANRSVPLYFFDTLLDLEGVQFHALQVGPGEEQTELLEWEARLCMRSSELKNYADTADVIAKLDLVISVDTSVAHLAGALGKTIWLLLPTNADGRWGREGNKTAWYSSMRLFRQSTLGNWDDVFVELTDALIDLKDC